MAIYGLQPDYMNKILSQYFGITQPTFEEKELYIGLGVTQHGALINTEDFTEVFGGRPLGNYKRSRVIFGRAEDCVIKNENEIVFNTASEDWTDQNEKIEMLGIFDTLDFEKQDSKEIIKPLVVLRLPKFETLLKGETLVLSPGAIELSLTDF